MKWLEKIKKINFKALIKGFTFVWGVALILFMTIASVGIDKKFEILVWLSSTLILSGIMIFGLFMGESLGKDGQENKVNGLYQRALKEYNDFRKAIQDIVIYFAQFLIWHKSGELVNKKIEYLVDCEMPVEKAENIVKYCVRDDYEKLLTRPIVVKNDKGEDVIIRKLEEFEKEPTKEVLEGRIKLDGYGSSYYLSALGRGTTKSILEVGKQIDKEIRFNKIGNRIIKIVFSLIFSFGLAILTVNEFMNGSDPQAWMNLFSRFAALFTSLFSGWLSSVVDVKLRAEKIQNKLDVLRTFEKSIKLKTFVPKTETELGREELEEYIKREEQAKNEVVDTEPVLEIGYLEQEGAII